MKKTIYFTKTFAFLATFAVIILFSTTNTFAQTKSKTTSKQTSKPAVISTTSKITQINEVKVKELLKPNGKPLLVNFWATWCIPCREEFPDLVELNEQYKGKIDFITISLDDLAEIDRDVPKFLAEMKATMPTYLLYTNQENEVIGSISKEWQGGLPFTILYDEKGEIVHTRQGKVKLEVVKSKIDNLFITNEVINELPKAEFYPKSKYNYGQGIADAKRDVVGGKYIIKQYGFGPGVQDSRNKLKEKYNIEYQEYGCFVDDNLVEYVKGYNEISRAAIKKKFNLDF